MENEMIRKCDERDFQTIYEIINEAAQVYQGIIPADRWKEPYMPKDELRHEIDAHVRFWAYEEEGELLGVMGIQDVLDVTLIRHAYVRTARQKKGIGGKLDFAADSLRYLGRCHLGHPFLPETRIPPRLPRGEGPSAQEILGNS
jgi:hypothetical protein